MKSQCKKNPHSLGEFVYTNVKITSDGSVLTSWLQLLSFGTDSSSPIEVLHILNLIKKKLYVFIPFYMSYFPYIK